MATMQFVLSSARSFDVFSPRNHVSQMDVGRDITTSIMKKGKSSCSTGGFLSSQILELNF